MTSAPESVIVRLKQRWLPRFDQLIWIGLIAFLGYKMWPQVAAAFGVDSANTTAPAFELTTLNGAAVSNAQLRGKVVLVNFWATWCPPCRIEMPGFQSVYDRKNGQGFEVLGISTDAKGSDHVRRYLADHQITYPVAMATGSVVQRFGGVNVLPSSFLIDRAGRVRHEVRGIFVQAALEQAVNRLLAEPLESPGMRAAPVAAEAR